MLSYTEGSDFTCGTQNRIFVCVPRTTSTFEGFRRLQTSIRSIAATMVRAGYKQVPSNLSALEPDGRPGPTTALGAQMITAVFAGAVPPPPEVAAILAPDITSDGAIRRVAIAAAQITAYFDATLRDHPEVLRNEPVVIERQVLPKWYSQRLLPILVASGFVLVGGIGMFYLNRGRTSVP